ncbi:hypothetical protein SLA2020_162010 [Shorea laevis]
MLDDFLIKNHNIIAIPDVSHYGPTVNPDLNFGYIQWILKKRKRRTFDNLVRSEFWVYPISQFFPLSNLINFLLLSHYSVSASQIAVPTNARSGGVMLGEEIVGGDAYLGDVADLRVFKEGVMEA